MTGYKNSALAAATAQERTINAQINYTTEERESQPRPLSDRDDCWPTVWETMQAEKVFRAMLEHEGKARVNSPQMCVKLAIIEVWRQGRIYQKRRETR
ncbi:MAG: hypothetical protein ACLU8W_10870 [Clostridia bacterium]